jgi:hypothetical protein
MKDFFNAIHATMVPLILKVGFGNDRHQYPERSVILEHKVFKSYDLQVGDCRDLQKREIDVG